MNTALTIAGSDCSGGAGIQADIKAMSANGVFAMSVITAITAQNTTGVFGIEDISPEMIYKQIKVIFEDIKVDAIKIGMVSKKESILAIIQALKTIKNLPPVILDPVMVSTSGCKLLNDDSKVELIRGLIPLAELITPNLPEAEEILGYKINSIEEMKLATMKLRELGCKYVLLKGGHLQGNEAIDIFYDGEDFAEYREVRIKTKNTHGTGCTLSSAIAANIGKGIGIKDAIRISKEYITEAIEKSFQLGKGDGPTNHFYFLEDPRRNY